MDTDDVKKALPALYAPRAAAGLHLVDVPSLQFLAVDGHGDPNVAPAHAEAVQALYTLSYAARAELKDRDGRTHVVGPLEGLWTAADPHAFVARDKAAWSWTMMVWQPDRVSPEVLEAAHARLRDRRRDQDLPGLPRVRLTTYAGGTCVQVLHVGPYDDEGPVLARMHEEFMPRHGLDFAGPHHEVYLSDPRRTAPDRLRTVLRQPVSPR